MKPTRYSELIEQATGSPTRPGNKLSVLQNGQEIFPAMLEAIRQAHDSIEFVTYVYWRSHIATEFADALAERARAGVSVRLLIDAVGGAIMSTRTIWHLERAGVKVAWFRPVRWPYLSKLNNRTHRKILVIDGRVGFTGGVGIADNWTGNAQDTRHWRETHCRIEGPACADLSAGFAENWLEATGEGLPEPPAVLPHGDAAIQTIIGTAGVRPTGVEQLFLAAMGMARKRLDITTAYFVPGPDVVGELLAAVSRGVNVRVLTNSRLSNHKITRLAGHASYPVLIEGGVEIYEYQPTVLHSKIVTVDGAWTTIGSTNLDARSLILNDELNIATAHAATVHKVDTSFEEDLKNSRQITSMDLAERSWWDEMAVSAANVFRNQL